MISWLKKHFIPNITNQHRPHLLRDSNMKAIIIFVIFLELITFIIPSLSNINMTGGTALVLPAVLESLTNEERDSQDLAMLLSNPLLDQAAKMKAEDMATHGYFAHVSPEGKTPWYWMEKVGYKYEYAGENLAINFIDSKDVTNAWMNSPTHRANIVKDKYTEVGTGIATGMYEGKITVFVAQVYAKPLIQVKTVSVQKTSPKTLAQKLAILEESKDIEVLGVETAKPKENVANTSPQIIQNPTFLQKTFASPRNTMNTASLVVFSIVAISLLLYVLAKVKHRHFDLITNGLIVLAMIGLISIANYNFTHHSMVIAQSINYSNGDK